MADINVPTDAPILPYHISHQLTSVARHRNGRIKKERNGSTKERRERVRQRKEKTEGGYSFPDKRHTPRQGRITVMTPASRDRESVKKISMTFASFFSLQDAFPRGAHSLRSTGKRGEAKQEDRCVREGIYLQGQKNIY